MNTATAEQELPPELATEEVTELTTRSTELAESYDDFTVNSAEEYATGAEHLTGIKTAQKEVEAKRTKITQPLVQAQRAANDFFRPYAERLKKAESAIKRGLTIWKNAQDKIARDAQREADRIAREEREESERLAKLARDAGRNTRAQQHEEKAAETVAPIVTSQAPKAAGISYRTVWKFRITDEAQIPRKFLNVDETKIRKVVKALEADADIPGVEIYSEKEIAARSR